MFSISMQTAIQGRELKTATKVWKHQIPNSSMQRLTEPILSSFNILHIFNIIAGHIDHILGWFPKFSIY